MIPLSAKDDRAARTGPPIRPRPRLLLAPARPVGDDTGASPDADRRRDMRPSVVFLGAWLAVAAAAPPARAADPPDLAKIDRRIKKEPAYSAREPLYALYVFGPEAKTRAW